MDNNEQPSKFFLQTEFKSSGDKTIRKLENGTEIYTSNKDIISHCRDFYINLFSEEDIDDFYCEEFLEELPTLSSFSADSIEGAVTKEEALFALKGMDNNKTPGLDGLSKEFYLAFWDLFGDILVNLYNLSFSQNSLSTSQKLGCISLLCKDPKNPTLLRNWRPISLLNVDYKILSRLLENRLSTVIAEIVHPDQTCSIKGRSIADNLHLLRNVVDYVEQKCDSVAFVCLDQEKAFDRVNHKFLFKALHKYGFGQDFIQWIELLYTDISSSVLVNGYVSDKFPVSRSVRQGCSLSPLLYVLVLEPFAIKVRNDKLIQGHQNSGA